MLYSYEFLKVPHPVIFRGAVFADNARFDRCLQLWVHALRLKQMNKVCVMKDLLRFAQVKLVQFLKNANMQSNMFTCEDFS